MLENGRSIKENGGVIIEGKKKGHHKDSQRWGMTSRSVKEINVNHQALIIN